MGARFLKSKDLNSWLKKLAVAYEAVYAPVESAPGMLRYTRIRPDREPECVMGAVRMQEPLKGFFLPLRGSVGRYLTDGPEAAGEKDGKTMRVVVGVKSCDLASLKILDALFCEKGIEDPFYVRAREETAIVSSDCTEPADSCFCRLVDVEAHCRMGYDVNLSAVDGGYVAETGTPRGEELLEVAPELFPPATEKEMAERDRCRVGVAREVDRVNEGRPSSESFCRVMKEDVGAGAWDKLAEPCVECAACTQVCPCCYCFVLHDQPLQRGFERIRNWDSCQYSGFARVAGGGNPRARRAERLRHRYAHKFDYLVESHGVVGCTGCGRCVELCMGGIDMREVIMDVAAAGAPTSP